MASKRDQIFSSIAAGENEDRPALQASAETEIVDVDIMRKHFVGMGM